MNPFTAATVELSRRCRGIGWWVAMFASGFFSALAQPTNDSFEGRLPIFGASAEIIADNSNATHEFGDPSLGDYSLWWTWTPPSSGTYTMIVSSMYSTPALGVFEGSNLTQLSLVSSNAEFYYTQARAVVELVGGNHYALAVSAMWGTGGGRFALQITSSGPPLVALTSPTDNAKALIGEPVTLEARASDIDGTVTNVEFFVNYVSLGSVASEPFRFLLYIRACER